MPRALLPLLFLPLLAGAQSPPLATNTTPTAPRPAANTYAPTWDTQKHARAYVLGIPAPRGQITDRNGEPLAVSRVSYNLAIAFPTPLDFDDAQVLSFVQGQLQVAKSILGRTLTLNAEQALRHYKNRGVLPYVIAQDLRNTELEVYHHEKPANLSLQPVYQRQYPNNGLAAHIVGYAGRAGRMPEGPVENSELLWPGAEGRDGLEKAFNEQLQGKNGQYNLSFDAEGKRASEQVTIPPQAGYNIVTTLDLNLQRLCEQTLEHGLKRGAMVIVDPANGDVLAMASWPTFNPNLFIPVISPEQFRQLNDDPDLPLLPRAFGSAYPPGSTFKILVGLGALQSGKIKPGDEFSCPAALEIGRITFHNWKHTDAGSMNFVDALTQSCDTWFYQVGMKVGAKTITDYAGQFGLGKKTGLPLAGESDGSVPTDEYLARRHLPKLLSGDLANLSIGQGYMEVTPLQLAAAMAAVGNGGTLFKTRLVQQVQSIDGQVVAGFGPRVQTQIEIDNDVMKNVRRGMINVVTGHLGTAGKAAVPNVTMAGKTGTAQWGPKSHERTAAWFCGFAPAEDPKYAFAVVYEGDAGMNEVHGGTVAAPLMGKVMREVFKGEKPAVKKRPTPDDDEDPDNSSRRRVQPDDDEDGGGHRGPAPTPPPAKKPSFWKRLFGT